MDKKILQSVSPLDTNGEKVHAHGGQLLFESGVWYWVGEDRRGEKRVSIYRSLDLKNWERRGGLSIRSAIDSSLFPEWRHSLVIDGIGCNLERPKIIRDEKYNRYVMWMHFETGLDYKTAEAAVAISDTIDGDYVFLGSFRPFGNMSRDLTVYEDFEGTAYMLSTSDDNRTLKMYRLRADCLTVEKEVNTLFPGGYREAPTVFRTEYGYYLITSGCTGWNPNQGMYSHANSMEGKWSELRKLGDETTYQSQPTWVFEHKGQKYYLGDRWQGSGDNYFNSTYVIIPLKEYCDGTIALEV